MTNEELQASLDAIDYIEDRLCSLQMDCYDDKNVVNAPLEIRDYLSMVVYDAIDCCSNLRIVVNIAKIKNLNSKEES